MLVRLAGLAMRDRDRGRLQFSPSREELAQVGIGEEIHGLARLLDHVIRLQLARRLTVASGLSAERLEVQLELVGRLNSELAPFRILTGIEVDILEDGHWISATTCLTGSMSWWRACTRNCECRLNR
jgi:hypothetical protein